MTFTRQAIQLVYSEAYDYSVVNDLPWQLTRARQNRLNLLDRKVLNSLAD